VGSSRTGRARRIAPATDIDDTQDLADHDYVSSFAADIPGADADSPEQWARSTLEGAPRALRWFVIFGWRFLLRLRLEPRRGAPNIAGWAIRTTTPGSIALEVHSGSLTAHKVLQLDPDRVVLTTFVRFDRLPGRVLWTALAPFHHRIEPLLLTLAASRFRKQH
jgi:hypothetical protein